mgnify:CR=1 FL=1|tara:strand:+ start:264 stop:740 length:477 start_codon:yes stop_codon:yes gene_type:complete
MIKLFISDLDGVLTDGSMYYSSNGDEIKRFSTYDGVAFEILRGKGIKTAIVTSENSKITSFRASKMKIDFVFQDCHGIGKLIAVEKICKENKIDFNSVSYIGDDINCFELLEKVNFAACPSNATKKILEIPKILKLKTRGGNGAVREYVEFLENNNLI